MRTYPQGDLFTACLADHDGKTYVPQLDKVRLNRQFLRVLSMMDDGTWRTLAEISEATGDPEASISARLRDMRKDKFGGRIVERRRRMGGIWEYRLGGLLQRVGTIL